MLKKIQSLGRDSFQFARGSEIVPHDITVSGRKLSPPCRHVCVAWRGRNIRTEGRIEPCPQKTGVLFWSLAIPSPLLREILFGKPTSVAVGPLETDGLTFLLMLAAKRT